MMLRPGIEPGPHWWEASALTTAPSLLLKECKVICKTPVNQLKQQIYVKFSWFQLGYPLSPSIILRYYFALALWNQVDLSYPITLV